MEAHHLQGPRGQSGGLDLSPPPLQMPPCQGNARKGAGLLENVLGAVGTTARADVRHGNSILAPGASTDIGRVASTRWVGNLLPFLLLLSGSHEQEKPVPTAPPPMCTSSLVDGRRDRHTEELRWASLRHQPSPVAVPSAPCSFLPRAWLPPAQEPSGSNSTALPSAFGPSVLWLSHPRPANADKVPFPSIVGTSPGPGPSLGPVLGF